MVFMSGRMVPAMAMVTSVPSPEHRGGFMCIHSSIQQLSMAGASYLSGVVIVQDKVVMLLHFNWVGVLSVCCTLMSIWISRRLVF